MVTEHGAMRWFGGHCLATCNAENFGHKCGMGPRCRGCWKSCHHAPAAES